MIVVSLLLTLLWLYQIVLLVRLVLDYVQMFARAWRPRGVVLVIAEFVYTLTDPPLRWLRRVIPPVRVGAVSLDLAFLALFVAVLVAMRLLASV